MKLNLISQRGLGNTFVSNINRYKLLDTSKSMEHRRIFAKM